MTESNHIPSEVSEFHVGEGQVVPRERPSSFVPVKFEDVPETPYGIRYEAYKTQIDENVFDLVKDAREGGIHEGEVYWVVGVSKNGVGQAVLDELAAQKATVVASSRKGDDNESAREMIARAKGLGSKDSRWVQMDITSKQDREGALNAVFSQYGRLDGLVIATGYPNDKPFADYTHEEIDEIYAINGTGPSHLIHEVLSSKYFKESGRIRIVIAGSVTEVGGTSPYGDAKALLAARTRSLGVEFKGAMAIPEGKEGHMDDARIVNLSIGLVADTNITKDLTNSQKRRANRAIASTRPLMAPEVAAVMTSFLHPDSKISGETIPMVGKDTFVPELDEKGLLKID